MNRRSARDDVIRASGITRSYGSVRVLSGVDLHAEKGTVLALLGPNGAGKTTMVRILSTLIKPDAGTATIVGHDTTFTTASQDLGTLTVHSDRERRSLRVPTDGRAAQVRQPLNRMAQRDVAVAKISLHRPALDEVFLALTGQPTRPATGEDD